MSLEQLGPVPSPGRGEECSAGPGVGCGPGSVGKRSELLSRTEGEEASTKGNPSVATRRREDGYWPREAIDVL